MTKNEKKAAVLMYLAARWGRKPRVPAVVRWLRRKVGKRRGFLVLSPYDFYRYATALDALPHNIMLEEPAYKTYSLDGNPVMFENGVKRNAVEVRSEAEMRRKYA